MDRIMGIKFEEDMFPRVFADCVEVEFGYLFYNEKNKTSYDSNHAVIYENRIEDLGEVLEKITVFYKEKDIHPSIYQSISDEGYFMRNRDTFEKHGYRVWTEGPYKFMSIKEENNIQKSGLLNIKRIDEWDERIAQDICIPSDEEHEIEVIKAFIKDSDSYVFAGYEGEKAAAITYLHVSDKNNCCRFDYIIVSKDHRNKGYGRDMVSHAVDFCREHGIENCFQWPAHETSERICFQGGFREEFSAEEARASYKER